MIALIALIVLETAAFISFIVIRNKRVSELKSEINLYRQLTGESKNNDAIVFVANLDNYSTGILRRLRKLIAQSYQQFTPQWPLNCFGNFVNELDSISNQEKKGFIKNTFTNAISLLDAKIFADIITKYLRYEGNFDEKDARDGLVIIMSVILKGGNAGQLATCFNRELEENIKELLDSSEIQSEEKILIHAGWIKIKKMLAE